MWDDARNSPQLLRTIALAQIVLAQAHSQEAVRAGEWLPASGVRRGQKYHRAGNSGSPDLSGIWRSCYPFPKALEPIVLAPASQRPRCRSHAHTWNSIPRFQLFSSFSPSESTVLRFLDPPATPPQDPKLSYRVWQWAADSTHCGEMREAPQLKRPCAKSATCHGWEWGTHSSPLCTSSLSSWATEKGERGDP